MSASRPSRPLRPRRWFGGVIAGVLVVPVVGSYGAALTAPGDDSFAIRSVEWVRDHGGAGLVSDVERVWYTWDAPPVGGTPPELPAVAAGPAPSAPSGTLPAPVATPAAVPLRGEGEWRPSGRLVNGRPAVLTTFVRPDAEHTALVSAIARLDPSLLDLHYLPGLEEPGGGPGPLGAEVPRAWDPMLVATFNAGFKTADSRGGAIVDGRTVVEMVPGGATLAILGDGSPVVGAWGVDIVPGRDVVLSARQNLVPLIEHGQLADDLAGSDQAVWGRTLGNTVLVWRSGVGQTEDGALVYVCGPGLSVGSLADLLLRAGCVRAMQLDINSNWVSFMTYTGGEDRRDPLRPGRLLEDMKKPADRYLHAPSNRDFFVATARVHPRPERPLSG